MSKFYHVYVEADHKWIGAPNNGGECCIFPEDTVEELNRLLSERDAANARIKRLKEAIGLALKMRQDWIEMQDEGYQGAYYAFVKNLDDEWNTIAKAMEAKP